MVMVEMQTKNMKLETVEYFLSADQRTTLSGVVTISPSVER